MNDYLEVVWNGTIEHAYVASGQRPAIPEIPKRTLSPTIDRPAKADPTSDRPCDRLLAFLLDHPEDVHTSLSVYEQAGIPPTDTATWLRRFWHRGYLEAVGTRKHPVNGQLLRAYQVRA